MSRGGSGDFGGGSSHSSSGFSSSRDSGSFGSGSRRSGSSGGSGYSGGSDLSSYYDYDRHKGSFGYRAGGIVSYVLNRAAFVLCVFAILFSVVMGALYVSGDCVALGYIRESTTARDKLESGYAFVRDCIDDEIGELIGIDRTVDGLKVFYDKTGVQPYVWMKAYDESFDPSSMSTEERKALADQYYDEHIDNEAAFLLVFFQDSAGELYFDYTVYIIGRQAGAVMDDEACGILEDYCGWYWYDDGMSTDNVLIKTFGMTGKRIMTKTISANDIVRGMLVLVLGAAVVVIIIDLLRLKRAHDKARKAEEAKILNASLGSVKDPTLQKYETGE